MTDTEILRAMFHDKVLIPVETDRYNKQFVSLIEANCPDSQLTIRHVPNDAIIIDVDNSFQAPNNLFKGKNGECKRADYIIISEEKRCIIYIEQKRTKDDWKGIVSQLQGAQCFLHYCQKIGEYFWKQESFLQHYQSRFVSFGHTNIPKKRTREERKTDKKEKHDTPKTTLKIDYTQQVQFNKIASLG